MDRSFILSSLFIILNYMMHLVIGLGNPGEEYANTYHNVGRLAVESWALGKSWNDTSLFNYQKNQGGVFVTTKTFMNESGAAVHAALDYFKIDLENLIVIHDDSDLLLGEYKISRDSGSAGHNGVQSVIDTLGTQDFTRVRIGIRSPEEQNENIPRKKAEDFVLKPIVKKNFDVLYGVFVVLREKLIENVTP